MATELKLANPHRIFKDDAIKAIEEHYNGKYIFDSCLQTPSGEWVNAPAAIFYTEQAHPDGSNYFALYFNYESELRIANGITATKPFEALMLEDGSILHSRYRHDYIQLDEGSMVDGGRDYMRCSVKPNQKIIKVKVVRDHLELVDAE